MLTGWNLQNNGPRPPIDSHEAFILWIWTFDVYFISKWIFGMLGDFIMAMMEWVHPIGRLLK